MSRLLFCSWEVIILENSLQNYQEKAAGEIIGTESSGGIEVIKKACLLVSGVGIRQHSSWKTSRIFLLCSPYFSVCTLLLDNGLSD